MSFRSFTYTSKSARTTGSDGSGVPPAGRAPGSRNSQARSAGTSGARFSRCHNSGIVNNVKPDASYRNGTSTRVARANSTNGFSAPTANTATNPAKASRAGRSRPAGAFLLPPTAPRPTTASAQYVHSTSSAGMEARICRSLNLLKKYQGRSSSVAMPTTKKGSRRSPGRRASTNSAGVRNSLR